MEQIAKAVLIVDWDNQPPERIEVQYNPAELSYDKGAQFAVVSGSGHYPWAENPAEFNEAFFGFLRKHLAS